jgi:uncharacterized SAM-dependent methyltransferase
MPRAEATARGLQAEPKELPAVWLYDERGSQLFEEITRLPEYYLTRREDEILRARSAEIADRTRARTVVELGAGTATNTRVILDALAGNLEHFVPLDLSEQTLRASARGTRAAPHRDQREVPARADRARAPTGRAAVEAWLTDGPGDFAAALAHRG